MRLVLPCSGPKPTTEEKERLEIPGDLWTKCRGCSAIIYSEELTKGQMVCQKCNYHFRLTTDERINLLCDRHSFEELAEDIRSNDPLSFRDSLRYRERLKKAEKSSGSSEAVKVGRAKING